VWLCAAPAARATEPFASGPVWGATFLSYPVGVRNIGMGASGTADVNSLSTGYFNPASVAFAKATTILGSYENQFLDTGLYDTRITSPIPFHSDSTTSTWHLAGSIGYTVLDIPAQTERTIFLPEGTGRTIDENDWMLSALGAASWSHGVMSFAAGGTTKMIQSAFSGPTIWSFDVGILAAFPITMNNGGRFRPRLGYSALNLDTGASDGSREVFVQTEKRGGFGFDLETPPVAVFEQSVPSARFSFDYDLIDRQGDSTTKYAVGFELAIVNMVSFRYGLIDDNYKTYGAGVGWDYGRALFRLDYAHTDRSENNTPLFLSGQNLDRDAFGAILGVRW
jgi:hypothetical protein